MYTIAMRKDKSLVQTEVKRIYQRETNTTEIRFLIPTEIDGNDLTKFICVFKFTLPNGQKYCLNLDKQPEMYNDSMDYRLMIRSDLTGDNGFIRGYLAFLAVIQDQETGIKSSYVMCSGDVSIEILPKTNIFAGEPNLQAIDRQILELENLVEEVQNVQENLNVTKADDIELIDGEVWLTANGKKIGDPIPYSVSDAATEETVRKVLESNLLTGGDANSINE